MKRIIWELAVPLGLAMIASWCIVNYDLQNWFYFFPPVAFAIANQFALRVREGRNERNSDYRELQFRSRIMLNQISEMEDLLNQHKIPELYVVFKKFRENCRLCTECCSTQRGLRARFKHLHIEGLTWRDALANHARAPLDNDKRNFTALHKYLTKVGDFISENCEPIHLP